MMTISKFFRVIPSALILFQWMVLLKMEDLISSLAILHMSVLNILTADDNVMPQTVEAINHASAAGVPIVFAINKIDKPAANPDKIKEELAGMNYLVEEWGGKYQSQDISAKKGIGVEELMEKVLLEAELLELKANPNRKATGSIIESSLDKGRGYVATVDRKSVV